MTLEVLKLEALKLSDKERADLAYELIHSLDDGGPADPDHARLWQEEIERRVGSIRDHTEELIPAEEVYASIRADLV